MSDKMDFEMANAGDTRGIIKAAQISVLKSMKDVIEHMKTEVGGPGLTWVQLDFLIEEFKKKEPTVVEQSDVF